MRSNKKLTWSEVINNIGKPVWDKKKKKYRVLDGYKRQGEDRFVTFTDCNAIIGPMWENFKEVDIRPKETKIVLLEEVKKCVSSKK